MRVPRLLLFDSQGLVDFLGSLVDCILFLRDAFMNNFEEIQITEIP